MGFRFRKSITLLPGVRLNLSKGGVSASVGRPGATINIGKRGVQGTTGIPGSGLSYSEMLVKRNGAHVGADGEAAGGFHIPLKRVLIFLAIAAVCFLAVAFFAGRSSEIGPSPASLSRAKEARLAAPIPAVTPDKATALAPAPIDAPATQRSSSNSAVIMAAVQCRSAPSKRARVVASIVADTRVAKLDTQGRWSKIQSGPAACWVSSDYLG